MRGDQEGERVSATGTVNVLGGRSGRSEVSSRLEIELTHDIIHPLYVYN